MNINEFNFLFDYKISVLLKKSNEKPIVTMEILWIFFNKKYT